MAVLTLVEAAKMMEPSKKAGVVDIYAKAYQPMGVVPVLSTGGKSAYQWTVDDGLSHTSGGKRNVGSDFTASAGRKKPYESEVKIYGGKIQVDTYIRDHSPASIEFEQSQQIKSYARELVVDIFEGAGGTSLRGFRDWMLYDAAYSGQEVSAGTTAGGDLPTLDKMDELVEKIDRTPDTFLYMTEINARYIKKLSRGNDTAQQRMQYGMNEFGTWSWMYDSIPVIILRDGKGTGLLSTVEIDGAASLSTSMSIYCIAWGPESAALFSSSQIVGANGVPLPKVVEQFDGSNYIYQRMEWYVGLVPHKPRCIARLKYVKNAVA